MANCRLERDDGAADRQQEGEGQQAVEGPQEAAVEVGGTVEYGQMWELILEVLGMYEMALQRDDVVCKALCAACENAVKDATC